MSIINLLRPACSPSVVPSTRSLSGSGRLDHNYLVSALGEKVADKLCSQLIGVDGRLLVSHFPAVATKRKKIDFTHLGQMVPPLVVIKPEELGDHLSFYPVSISSEESDSYREALYRQSRDSFFVVDPGSVSIDLHYLKCFLLIVKKNKLIFVADDHTYAAYALALAKGIGFINELALFNFDQHTDSIFNDLLHKELVKPGGIEMGVTEVAKLTQTNLEINQWLMFACKTAGLMREEDVYYILTKYLNSRKPGLRNSRTISEVINEMQRVKNEGKGTVMSYDLDLLAYQYAQYCEILPEDIKVDSKTIDAVIREAARISPLTIIATSPDYFNADKRVISDKIREIVEAA
ncbi:MAG: hypothetical protein ABIH50_00995 [bacterium]